MESWLDEIWASEMLRRRCAKFKCGLCVKTYLDEDQVGGTGQRYNALNSKGRGGRGSSGKN